MSLVSRLLATDLEEVQHIRVLALNLLLGLDPALHVRDHLLVAFYAVLHHLDNLLLLQQLESHSAHLRRGADVLCMLLHFLIGIRVLALKNLMLSQRLV